VHKPLMTSALSDRSAAAKCVLYRCVIEMSVLLQSLDRVPYKRHFSCYGQLTVRIHKYARVKAVVHASQHG